MTGTCVFIAGTMTNISLVQAYLVLLFLAKTRKQAAKLACSRPNPDP